MGLAIRRVPLRAVVILVTLGILCIALAAEAQQPTKVYRIGRLAPGSPLPEANPNLEAFRQGLPDLGWVEGQNLAMQCATEGGGRFPALVADLPVGQPTNEVRMYGARYSRGPLRRGTHSASGVRMLLSPCAR
jgi:hypothetical protein